MPVTPTYPGVYIEEIPSGVRSIAGDRSHPREHSGRCGGLPDTTAPR